MQNKIQGGVLWSLGIFRYCFWQMLFCSQVWSNFLPLSWEAFIATLLCIDKVFLTVLFIISQILKFHEVFEKISPHQKLLKCRTNLLQCFVCKRQTHLERYDIKYCPITINHNPKKFKMFSLSQPLQKFTNGLSQKKYL